MLHTTAKTVDQYLALLPKDIRTILEKVRATIKATAPKAEEVISYSMPGYTYHGPLVYFAAQKHFCSFYGVNKLIIKIFAKEISLFEVSGTTIHFTPNNPLPASLIKKIVKERMLQNEMLAGAKKR